jgi:hypothetical protein
MGLFERGLVAGKQARGHRLEEKIVRLTHAIFPDIP